LQTSTDFVGIHYMCKSTVIRSNCVVPISRQD